MLRALPVSGCAGAGCCAGSLRGRFKIRFGSGFLGALLRGPAVRAAASPFVVQRLEDSRAQTLLELEERLDAREIDAAIAGQVPDPHDPADVLLGVEADVGGGSRRADETFVLVDPQRPRMRCNDARRNADHVDGPPWVTVRPAHGHVGQAPRSLPAPLVAGWLCPAGVEPVAPPELIEPVEPLFVSIVVALPPLTGLIRIWRGFSCSALGIRSVRTPFSKLASALSASRPFGSVSVRTNVPRLISRTRYSPSPSRRSALASPRIVSWPFSTVMSTSSGFTPGRAASTRSASFVVRMSRARPASPFHPL